MCWSSWTLGHCVSEQLLSLLMNHQASAASAQVGNNAGGGTGQGTVSSSHGSGPSGATDVLHSLYKQMRESRHSGDAASFGGGWPGGFSGHQAHVMGSRRPHAHVPGSVAPGLGRSFFGLEAAIAPYYDPMAQAHQEAMYHQMAQGGGGGGAGAGVVDGGGRGLPHGYGGGGSWSWSWWERAAGQRGRRKCGW